MDPYFSEKIYLIPTFRTLQPPNLEFLNLDPDPHRYSKPGCGSVTLPTCRQMVNSAFFVEADFEELLLPENLPLVFLARLPSKGRTSSPSGGRRIGRTTGTGLASPNRTPAAIRWTVHARTGTVLYLPTVPNSLWTLLSRGRYVGAVGTVTRYLNRSYLTYL